MPGYANPQALNRYMYVLGNPLRYTDPTGHMQWEDTYEENDGVCNPGDASCNWLDGGNPGVGADPDDILNGDDNDSSNDEYTPSPAAIAATLLDGTAALTNAGYAFVGDLIGLYCAACYVEVLAFYQVYSFIPNSISTLAMAFWIADGIIKGENSLYFSPSPDGLVTIP